MKQNQLLRQQIVEAETLSKRTDAQQASEITHVRESLQVASSTIAARETDITKLKAQIAELETELLQARDAAQANEDKAATLHTELVRE